MKVAFLTSGPVVPSTRFRILQYLPALRTRGIACSVFHSFPGKYNDYHLLSIKNNQRARQLMRAVDLLQIIARRFDLIVVEREIMAEPDFRVERWLTRTRIPIVLDVDDGVYLSSPEKYEFLLPRVRLVLAGNEGIVAHCEKFASNVKLLPTVVDTARYLPVDNYEDRRRTTVGWTGTAYNQPSLALAAEALGRLADSHQLQLSVVAEDFGRLKNIVPENVPVVEETWSAETEIESLRKMDIGIMPLEDTKWNQLKCGFKIIQYMAIGLPAVASPLA